MRPTERAALNFRRNVHTMTDEQKEERSKRVAEMKAIMAKRKAGVSHGNKIPVGFCDFLFL